MKLRATRRVDIAKKTPNGHDAINGSLWVIPRRRGPNHPIVNAAGRLLIVAHCVSTTITERASLEDGYATDVTAELGRSATQQRGRRWRWYTFPIMLTLIRAFSLIYYPRRRLHE